MKDQIFFYKVHQGRTFGTPESETDIEMKLRDFFERSDGEVLRIRVHSICEKLDLTRYCRIQKWNEEKGVYDEIGE